ncbi:MAG: FAD-dependent monooxygenase [Alcanivorax sp.]
MENQSLHTDILIVGGGMAGGLLGLLLADEGFAVRVLDAGPAPARPSGESAPRVSTLSEASHWLLRHAGVWERLDPERVQAYASMQVWDRDGTGEVRFSAADAGADCLGWLLENDHLTAALFEAAGERDTLAWHGSTPVDDLTRDGDGWCVTAGAQTFTADLLVGADGARSRVRDAAGIPAPARDSGHRALVATIETDLPHGGCARQVFMDSGPLALLPLFGHDGRRCSIVWSAWPQRSDELMALDDDAFGAALSQATGEVLGAARVVSRRAVFPIEERHASRYQGRALALVGDAAHVIHPLAGQGINLGLLDAAVLAEELGRARDDGLPGAHAGILARYERRRRADNLLMQNAMRGFKLLFERPEPAVRWLRNTGLGLVNRLAPARHAFMHRALGRAGDLPRNAKRP